MGGLELKAESHLYLTFTYIGAGKQLQIHSGDRPTSALSVISTWSVNLPWSNTDKVAHEDQYTIVSPASKMTSSVHTVWTSIRDPTLLNSTLAAYSVGAPLNVRPC